MKKPNELVLWIYDSWPITSVSVRQGCGPTGDDTRFILVGQLGEREVDFPVLMAVAQLEAGYNCVARLRSQYQQDAQVYREWEKANAADIKEFKRLAEKLGITT